MDSQTGKKKKHICITNKGMVTYNMRTIGTHFPPIKIFIGSKRVPNKGAMQFNYLKQVTFNKAQYAITLPTLPLC